jgi:hypothetical protein
VEEREREREGKNRGGDGDGAAGEEKQRGARIRESREGEMEFSQGPMRNFRKFQGPVCKV